ncbi:MAG: flagellar basal body P-ring protein FlgI [Sphingomonadales bacterium]
MSLALAPGLLGFACDAASAASRIKDIVDFEGVRENHLLGYGLVVGLDGTGDTLQNAPFTEQSLQAMLERLGINTRGGQSKMRTENVAAVIVTASLPPFARHGSRIDVTVSTLGDAESLLGGTLLATPLRGADGEVYSVAQGSVTVGGFKAQGDAGTVIKGVITSGRIANGGVIEREIAFNFASMRTLRLSLRNPDITTANRVAGAIDRFLGGPAAKTLDPGTVRLSIPNEFKGDIVTLLADVEQLRVEPDQIARVVIDEVSGVIVMGSNVRISTVAIAQGNLTIRVTETPQVSQPAPFSQGGETVTVPRTEIAVEEGDKNRLTVLDPGVSLQDLVDGLNALGIGPRDMISILQALKAAGALQADIEIL